MRLHYVVQIPFDNRGKEGEILACYASASSAVEVAHRTVGWFFKAFVAGSDEHCPVCSKQPPFLTQCEEARDAA